jgi:osmoprotectant transport system permease protein
MDTLAGTAVRQLARAAALPALALACFVMPAAHADETLRIGSKRFTEAYILAQILAQTAQAADHTKVEVKAGLGNTAIVYEALRSGAIDLYPEYTGTIDLEILKNAQPTTLDAMNRQLAPLGFGIAVPLGFNNGYALAMRAADAERLGIKSLSDLARHPELKLGLSNEFIGRADGWQGLAQRYGLPQKPIGLDHGIAFDALAKGQIDVTDIYTTDAQIEKMKLAVLADDRGYFPRYEAVLLYRLDVPQRFAQAWAALQKLAGSIDERAMIAMNARAELQGVPFETIARDHLSGRDKPEGGQRGFWAKLTGPDLGRLTLQHLWLVAASVAAAALIGIPLALAVAARPRLRAGVLGATGLLQTIPSLALLAALISWFGIIGTVPALIALTLYALLPIMRNTCTGVAEIPAGLIDAARSLGLSKAHRLRLVELPLAAPTIIAGIRIAAVIAVGTATIAAFIGAGGFGERIVTGLALNDGALLLAGALPAALMAVTCELVFEAIEAAVRRRRGQSTQQR